MVAEQNLGQNLVLCLVATAIERFELGTCVEIKQKKKPQNFVCQQLQTLYNID
jgi:hypothetical protein